MLKKLSISFSLLALVSCGGGGGSGNAGGGSPLSTDTISPVVSFTPSSLTVTSGGTGNSTLSATDNIGVTVGPTVTCTNSGIFSDGVFSAPSVSVDTTSVCTATATDAAGNNGSATLTVTIVAPQQSRSGKVVGVYSPPLKLIHGTPDVGGSREGYSTAVFGTRETSGSTNSDVEIVAIAGDAVFPLDYDRDDHVVVEGTFRSVEFIQTPSLFANGLGDFGMSVIETSQNRLYWYYGDNRVIPESFTQREVIDVESPCVVRQTSASFANDVVIGQRLKGLSVFDVDTGTDFTNTTNFSSTFMYNVGDGRSLCHILRGVVPGHYIDQFPSIQNANGFGQPLTAIDYETNEFVFYGDKDGDNKLDELGTVDLLTNSTASLEIVDVISRGLPNQVPRYFLILLSNGQHNGTHRLVLAAYNNDTLALEQSVIHSWSEGVPIAMAQSQFGGATEGGIFRSDLIVVLGTSDNSFFFDNKLLAGVGGNSLPPIYGTPELLHVGPGAGSAVAAGKPDVPTLDETDWGILVSFPDNGEVRYISPDVD